jgi:hypothetical protein
MAYGNGDISTINANGTGITKFPGNTKGKEWDPDLSWDGPC